MRAKNLTVEEEEAEKNEFHIAKGNKTSKTWDDFTEFIENRTFYAIYRCYRTKLLHHKTKQSTSMWWYQKWLLG